MKLIIMYRNNEIGQYLNNIFRKLNLLIFGHKLKTSGPKSKVIDFMYYILMILNGIFS